MTLTPHTKSAAVEALRKLVRTCNYRDAVVASGHRDKLDYAVENYSMAIEKAQAVLEALSDEKDVAP